MPSKYQIMRDLADKMQTEVLSSEPTYLAFLRTAARNYKYNFKEQLLIFEQKPDAIACAGIDVWNRLGRWVNKGTRGIALLDVSAPGHRLRYVFDLTDTNSYAGRTVKLWEMQFRHEEAVMEALADTLHIPREEMQTFPEYLETITDVLVEDNYTDYFRDLMLHKADSLLEELDEQNTELELKRTMKSSILYMLLIRCGYDPAIYMDELDFSHIRDFDSPDVAAILGSAVSDISEVALREISVTVQALERAEKNQNRTFAKSPVSDYDRAGKQSSQPDYERSEHHAGTELYQAGGLPDPRPGGAGGPEDRQVRDPAAQLPAGPSHGSLRRDAVQGNPEPAPGADRPGGQRNDGAADRADGQGRGRDGAAESGGSDGLGRRDEQHQGPSGGDRPERSDLRLEDYPEGEPIFPSESEQQDSIAEAEADKASAFVISQEDIDYILGEGSNYSDSKYRIYSQYLRQEPAADNAKFLKTEYGTGGVYPIGVEKKFAVDYDAKGIRIRLGNIVHPDADKLLNWAKVEKRIRELIQAGRYLTPDQLQRFPEWRQNQLRRQERQKVTAEILDIFRAYNEFLESTGSTEGKLNLYVLSDCLQSLVTGEKTTYTLRENNFVLPLVRTGLRQVIDANSHLTERAAAALEAVNGEMFRHLEPSYDELNPPPKPKMEYRWSLGETVYLGMKQYELLLISDTEVRLYDPSFPLINKELSREDFDKMVAENPLNDSHLVPVEAGPKEEKAEDPKQESEPKAPPTSKADDRLDEMLRQAELAVELSEQTGQNVFAFEEGNPLPVNPPTNAETPAPAEEEKPEPEALPAPPKRVPARKLPPSVLHPEVKDADRHDYRITEDSIGVGTPTERYYNNVAAIRLLKKLEAEQRLATQEEQGVLARYVGWGGLASCFEETSSHYQELKGLLSEEEYASARASTLTAFYTPPVVIRSIYLAMEQMGFKRGNLLEPACGIGNFMGMLPDSMRDSKLYGVELDSVSGRIARQLYQRASIAVQGYETTQLPDSFFDGAIGNVPFGQFKVADKRYDKHNFLIHDYFFAKTLDKVRPGGIIALVTSKGTMDKENPAIRKYIAQRADLLGAIRLPNDTFKRAAGTDVTSDILFLQKRDRLIDIEPDWVSLDTDPNGVRMNRYFVQNPDMVLGEMQTVSGPYGPETACVPYGDQSLEDLLSAAIQNIHADYTAMDLEEVTEEEADQSIPADPGIRNFSYSLVEGKLYYRQNSVMTPVELSLTGENRVKGMIGIRDSVRRLIEYQTEDYPEEMIVEERANLNRLYDAFVKSYGTLNTRANKSAFANDSSASLLSSLEVLDDEGRFVRKADMFTKRTIKQKVVVTSVDTASEALAISLAEKAKVDMPFMMGLTGKTEQTILEDLEGVIFRNPQYSADSAAPGVEQYLPADEYLSGNVRQKLREAKKSAEISPADYAANVKALEQVQPKDLSAAEISVRLGATWLPPEVVEDFMFQLLSTSRLSRWNIHVHYSRLTGEWSIEGRSSDPRNIKAISTYGTDRINAYKIIEQTLNLKDVRVMDYIEDENGRKVPVLNKKETAIAQGKQALIKQAFADWIWKDPDRRQKLCKLYNEKFNSTRPREYDGSHLNFVGINPEIRLRPHQVNAIAHILYGGNTLLAHVVGAGKTFEMVAAAQESKRLGLCHKSLFVVPNHLTEQWASEYLQLYPAANILVATKKDFETKNRKRFCSRIATGDYDAIIIGHSQFEKIPMSVERQQQILQQELEEIINGIAEAKRNRGDNFTIKQMEKAKKAAEIKLSHLNDQSRKDDVVTFEELGVDRLFVDEAHYYKNLAAFSKMRNVGGISQTEAQKSSDLYMKCRYLDEITGGRGVVFATGTPISNSMVEMFTMQKYLQYGLLEQQQLTHFDAWASTFGETVTAIELAPEGTGYRSKTRFSRFYNLPELMSMFKQTADIQTADMLNLPVPKANYHNVVLKPSETQKEMVRSLSERAEKVRNRMVSSNEDNMLLITNDGRKLALDQRLMNDWLPDHENSKVNACAANVYEIWQRTAEQRSTQMVFCDLSTPHSVGTSSRSLASPQAAKFDPSAASPFPTKSDDFAGAPKSKFNIYDDLKQKLMEKGIPEEEIAYIHSAASEAQKKELFGKVRSGQIRVLIGSTQKMGAGTNVQKKLIALHHLDCPWRPSDLQQREGRIIRQGNENPEVEIYTYVTENTFDSYLYQLVEGKQKFIGQIMTSKSPVRSAEDVDEQALSYAEIKALCTGNPHIKEKMDLDIDVARLKLLKANHLSERYALEDHIIHHYPAQIRALEQKAEGYTADIERVKENTHPSEDGFSPMVIEGTRHTEKKAAGSAILEACKAIQNSEPVPLGQYRGFEMELCFDPMFREYKITLIGSLRHQVFLGSDVYGNIQRLDNALEGLPASLAKTQEAIKSAQQNLDQAKAEINKPFPFEEELATKSARLGELNAMLDMDKPENAIVDGERGEEDSTTTPEQNLER